MGEFYLEIAKNRYPAVSDSVQAEKVLRAEGFRLPALDPRKVLTEGDVVRISEQLGIRLSTTRPEVPATKGQVEAFARTFAGELSGSIPTGDPDQQKKTPPRTDPNPDKGKSKGFYKSMSEPI